MGKENSNVSECCSFVGTNIKFGCKMARKLTWCSRDGNYANLIDYFAVNRRLAGSLVNVRNIFFLLEYIQRCQSIFSI